MMETELNEAIIFGAMMRPPMFMGVHVDFILFIFFGASFLFIMNPIIGFLSLLPFWLVGWLIGKFDPDGIKIILMHKTIMGEDGEMLKYVTLLTYLPW